MVIFTTFAFFAALISLGLCNYHIEHYKVYKFDGGQESEPLRKPWFFEEYSNPHGEYDVVTHAVSEPYEYTSEQKSPEVYEAPIQVAPRSSIIKKIPNEDKSFKKSISPFYTLTESDNEKYKSIIMKSGAPYCQEIKSQVNNQKRYRRDAMTCYKCKDPKNGATFEQCSYTSEPQETTLINKRVPISTALRYRRSNSADKEESGATSNLSPTQFQENYRFGDEYFAPAASEKVSAEHKKSMENCEKVVKDSMVCMVCKDPKTNGKYEQCSYTNQPSDKAYGYSKSSSFGDVPGDKKIEESKSRGVERPASYSSQESAEEIDGSHPEVDKYIDEQKAAIKSRTPKYAGKYDEGESEVNEKLESGAEHVKDGSCKKVAKDNMVCTICKDPKTGGNYEQCAYAYKPNDKVYQFSRSKTFGFPGEGGGKSSGEANKDVKSGDNYDYQGPRDYYNKPEETSSEKSEDYGFGNPTGSEEYAAYNSSPEKSESEEISEEVKKSSCEKVQKDSMTCMVCKDPKTGGNYEQCSYAYEPDDKLFSFSKSKSFGSPEAEDKAKYTSLSDGSGEEGNSGYGDTGGYGLASDNKPYVTNGKTASESRDEVDVGYFNTAEKKKEIEKVLSEFEQEDRSKCKKVFKDKLTCFQCTDKDGMQKEECIFVASEKPSKDRVAYREVKEFQKDPVATAESAKMFDKWPSKDIPTFYPAGENHAAIKPALGKKIQKRKTKKTSPSEFYDEPTFAASDNEEQISQEENSNLKNDEEAYDYAAATQPVFDKALGFTLPRYMVTTSEHEIEFDKVVESGKI